MPVSVVDLYRDYLPKTNCGDCGFPTCIAFAGKVVSERHPVADCPHIDPGKMEALQAELSAQHETGRWLRRDPAGDALAWARERAASMAITDLPKRIGGELVRTGDGDALKLPYFNSHVFIGEAGLTTAEGEPLNRWEQVFIYNHMAQGGRALPTGNRRGFESLPNTVSKMKSMKAHVEVPIAEAFQGRAPALLAAARALGGKDASAENPGADAAVRLRRLPRVPVVLLFWDAEPEDGFEARAKLLFDETVTEHLDIESILFLSERIRQLLCGDDDP